MKESFCCRLCGCTAYHQRQGHARDNAMLVPFQCDNCGLVQLSSFEHICDNFYEDAHMHDDAPVSAEVLLAQNKEDSLRRAAQFRNIIEGKHILDIGCGAGGFLLAARDIAASVGGVEPELRLSEHFRKNQLLVYPHLSVVPQDKKVDVVTMFHVLEHMSEPIKELVSIRNFLKDSEERTLIIEVPSASDALLTLYNNKQFSQFTYWSCHLYLFTESTLRACAEKAGFATVKILQYQRYPLANHLFWLAQGKPGGQHAWTIFNNPKLMEAYAEALAENKLCDTIIGIFSC